MRADISRPCLAASRSSRDVVCLLLALAVGAAGLVGLDGVAGPARAQAAVASSRGSVSSMPDAASAMLAAQRQGSRVEVLDERSETTQVWANPDGSYTSDVAAGPVRLLRGGGWVDVDSTLKTAGGVVTTTATPSTIDLSDGGNGSLASATTTGDEGAGVPSGLTFGVDWPSSLPAPTLSGATATYANVAPGVDVTVTALADGFTDNVILHSRPSSAPVFRLPLHLAGMNLSISDGVFRLTDANGALRAVAPAPQMWDASTDPTTGLPTRSAPLSASVVTVGGKQMLQISPDAAWLSDPSTTYPVTLDPTTTLYTASDTWVESDVSTNQNGASDLRAGHSASATARSLIKFDLSSIANTQIVATDFYAMQIKASTCQAETIGLHKVISAWTPTTITWASGQPSVVSTPLETNSNAYGYSTSCPANYAHWEDDNSTTNNLTSLVQGWANGSIPNNGFELKAEDETNAFTYKRWNSADYGGVQTPRMTITYNHYPLVSRPHVIGLVTVGATNYVGTTTPNLYAQVSDSDGSQVRTAHDIYYGATKIVSNLLGGYVASGGYSHATVPAAQALVDGDTYGDDMYADDGLTRSTGYQQFSFTVDASPPSTPTVSSTQYPSGQWNTAGGSGTFTLSATDAGAGVDHYVYSLDNPTPSTALASGATSVAVTPMPDGWHTLYVEAVDKVGHVSGIASYSFGATPAVTSPSEGAVTQNSILLTAQAAPTGGAQSVTYYDRRSAQDPWTPIPAADVSTTSSGPTFNGWPYQYATSGDSGVPASLTWNAASTLGTDGPAQVAVCFGATCPVLPTSALPAGSSTQPRDMTLDRNAFDVAATQDLTPGAVNLLTGDFQYSATDVAVPGNEGNDLSVGRTLNTTTVASTHGIFGDGWTANLPVDAAGMDYTGLSDTGSVVTGAHADQSTTSFTTTATTGVYTPTGADADSGLTLKTTSTACATGYACYEIDDLDGNRAVFQSTTVNPGAASPANPVAYLPIQVVEPGSANTTTFSYTSGLVTRITSPTPTGGTCTDPSSASTWTPGCRALGLTYNASNQVTAVNYVTSDGTNPLSVPVSCYAYTGSKLTDAWDPRGVADKTNISCGATPTRATHYSYDSSGRLATVTPDWNGTSSPIAGWTLAYDGSGRIATVTRTHSGGGSEVTAVLYRVPLATDASNDRPDLTSASTAGWAQTDNPDPNVGATAICPPGSSVPSDATGNLTDCTLTYLDANGRAVNTAGYSGSGASGWHVTTSEFDSLGHTIRTLSAKDREEALTPSSGAGATLGLPADTAQAAMELSTLNIYTANPTDGQPDLTSTYGPYHQVMLASGDIVDARQLTQTSYDQGSDGNGHPTGVSYHLPVDVKTGASQSPDANPVNEGDVRETATRYYTSADTTDGWTYRTPLQTIVDPNGLKITTTTQLDPATGRTVATQQPLDTTAYAAKSTGQGASAADTITIYYSAGANTQDSACGNAPLYDGLVCKTEAANPTPTSGLPSLLTTWDKSYDYLQRPTEVDETATPAGGSAVTRVTSTIYGFNSTISSGVSANPYATTVQQTAVTGGQGAAIPAQTTSYDTATGLATGVSNGVVADATSYDDFGRVISYTDNTSAVGAQANTTTTTYDPSSGRVTQTADAHTTETYTYDQNGEHRGLASSLAVTVNGSSTYTGTFTASYDADGNLAAQTDPNGILGTYGSDETGQAASITDTQSGTPWLTDSAMPSINGQWLSHTGPAGMQTYSYDAAGRLTEADDKPTTGACGIRAYSYDADSNRATSTSYPANSDGTCQTGTYTGGAATSHTYDTADRLQPIGTDSGTVYDAFGRITTVPASDVSGGANLTNTYYVNDLVNTETQGTTTQTWTLDPEQRVGGWTVTTNGTTTATKTNHYDDANSDSPDWIAENSTASTWTANITDLTGGLAVTVDQTGTPTYQYADMHGNIMATAPQNAASPTLSPDYDEFGNNPAGGNTRYGWLGGKQRSGEDLGNVLLMGVRLYDPVLGRFLQTDPIPGGSANNYDYVNQDPINGFDLGGTCWGWGCGAIIHAAHKVAHVVEKYHSTVGNMVGEYAGYGAFLPGGVGAAFGGLSLAGYAAAGNWRQVRSGAVGLVAGVVGGRLLKRAADAAWAYRGASRVVRSRVLRGIKRVSWARGAAYNMASYF